MSYESSMSYIGLLIRTMNNHLEHINTGRRKMKLIRLLTINTTTERNNVKEKVLIFVKEAKMNANFLKGHYSWHLTVSNESKLVNEFLEHNTIPKEFQLSPYPDSLSNVEYYQILDKLTKNLENFEKIIEHCEVDEVEDMVQVFNNRLTKPGEFHDTLTKNMDETSLELSLEPKIDYDSKEKVILNDIEELTNKLNKLHMLK